MATAKGKSGGKKKAKDDENLIDQARDRLEELGDSEQAQEAKRTYQQIWRAGLGAFARRSDAISDAAKETSEDSEKFFKKLVKDGQKLEKKAKKELDGLKDKVEDKLDKISDQANSRVSKLETAFDKRVAQAYNRLGLPSKKDIDELHAKIDELQKTVDANAPAKTKTKAKTNVPAKAKTTARKTPVQKAAASKAPAK